MFQDKLISLRKSKFLTQDQLAKEIYVSRSAIAKWEQGRGLPDYESLNRIAEFFNLSLEDLISDTEINLFEENNKYNSLFQRIDKHLHNNEFNKAKDLIDTILYNDPTCFEAYLYKMCIEFNLDDINKLGMVNIKTSSEYKRILLFANDEQIKKLEMINNEFSQNEYNKKAEKIYDLANQALTNNKYDKAKKLFLLIEDYKDSKEKLNSIEDEKKEYYYNLALTCFEQKKYHDCYSILTQIKGYKDSESYLQKAQQENDNLIKEKIYQNAINMKNVDKAIKEFEKIIDYKDSKELIYKCIDIKKKRKHKTLVNSCIAISVLIGACCIGYVASVIVQKQEQKNLYMKAINYMEEQQYDLAKDIFVNLPSNTEIEDYLYCIDIYDDISSNNDKDALDLFFSKYGKVEAQIKNCHYDYMDSISSLNDIDYIKDNDHIFSNVEVDIKSFDYKMKTMNVDLDVIYSLKQYSIAYVLDGGINPASNPRYYNLDSDFELKPASKQGYIFDGWYFDREFQNIASYEKIMALKKDIRLFARFF